MDLTIRDARADDGAAIASLLGQLGYETEAAAVAPRLERLMIVGDRVVVEEGACIGAGAHVEPGTRVPSGWIYAGRPAKPFRALKPGEREGFADIIAIYAHYSAVYRGT